MPHADLTYMVFSMPPAAAGGHSASTHPEEKRAVSTDDVATVRKAYAAFNGNNIPALLNLLAPNVTWCNPAELP
jgi:hypothetical protein